MDIWLLRASSSCVWFRRQTVLIDKYAPLLFIVDDASRCQSCARSPEIMNGTRCCAHQTQPGPHTHYFPAFHLFDVGKKNVEWTLLYTDRINVGPAIISHLLSERTRPETHKHNTRKLTFRRFGIARKHFACPVVHTRIYYGVARLRIFSPLRRHSN